MPALHQTQRDGWQRYVLDGLPNGRYLLTLHFSEQLAHGPGQRIFDVVLQEKLVLADFDLVAEAGRDYAVVRRFLTTVENGRLLLTASGDSSLAALELVPVQPDDDPPTAPEGLTAVSGYRAILLNWTDSPETDVVGYHVYRSAGSTTWRRMTVAPITPSRFANELVGDGTFAYRITAVDAWGNESLPSDSVTAHVIRQVDFNLPVLELTVPSAHLDKLLADPFTNDRVDGWLRYDGHTYPIETRFRGWLGRHFPKKSWKIFFPGASPFPGQDRINLNADYGDWSLLRGLLSLEQLAQAGSPAPHAEPVVLLLNGEYMGLYIRYEQIDEAFLARTGQNPGASIYKVVQDFAALLPNERAYKQAYEKETNRGMGYDDIIAFVELINQTPDDQFPYEIAQVLDVPAYLRYYATMVLISHLDFTWHNTYLIHDLETERWTVVPWDFDMSWGTDFQRQLLQPNYPINMGSEAASARIGSNRLLSRLLDVPHYRAYYCQQLDAMMQGSFSTAAVAARLEQLYGRVARAGLADWRKYGWEEVATFTTAPAQMRQYVTERHAFLRQAMGAYCPTEALFLQVNELMVANETAVCDPAEPSTTSCYESWFELYNPALLPVDLQGYYLSNDGDNLQQHRIDVPLVVPPLGHLLLWADGEPEQEANHLSFELVQTGTVYLSDANGRLLLQHQYSVTLPDHSNGRLPDGSQQWQLFSRPTAGSRNQMQSPQVTQLRHFPSQPQAGESVSITAAVVDDGTFALPQLHVQVNGQGFVPLVMHSVGGDFYRATMPAAPSSSRVQYYLTVTDNDGNVTTLPAAAPDDVYEYRVDYQPPPLRINEFMANNQTALADPAEPDEYPDWIEIYNPTPHTVDLGGMSLSDDLAVPGKFLFSDDVSLAPGGVLVVYADNDPEQGELHADFRLDGAGEAIGLFGTAVSGYQPLDTVTFGVQAADAARGRCPDGGDWQLAAPPSPGWRNQGCPNMPPHIEQVGHQPPFPQADEPVQVSARVDGAEAVWLWYTTPDGTGQLSMVPDGLGRFVAELPPHAAGTLVSYYVTAVAANGLESSAPRLAPAYDFRFRVGYERPLLYFNELMARNERWHLDPAEPEETPDWFEIYNAGSRAVDLGGLYLTDDLADPRQYRIPDGVVALPGSFVLFLADDDPEQGPIHTNFTLSGAGEVLGLFAADGEVLIEAVVFGKQPADQSYGRLIDGEGVWQNGRCVTPAAANGCQALVFLPLIVR